MDNIEKLKFIIHRIDNYYNGVNSKGSLFLGINTFILGGCLAAIQSKEVPFCENIWIEINFIMIVLLSIFSIGSILCSILPFLKHGNSYDYESNIFFGAIAQKEIKKFHTEATEFQNKVFEDDMVKQIHTLSKGLNSKYHLIRNAGISLFFSIVFTIPFFYQIIQLKS